MKTLPILQDGNEFYQEMTTKEYIHELEMALINVNEAEKMLRESNENHLIFLVNNDDVKEN